MENAFTEEEKLILDNSVKFMETCEKGILIL